MAAKKASTTTTTTDLFSEPEETVVETTETAKEEIVAPGAPDTKKGRVKGTWRMHWGSTVYDFVDGTTYTLPVGLYNHLKAHGNIYDTL